MNWKVLVADKVDGQAIDILKENEFEIIEKFGLSEEELINEVKYVDAIILRSGVKITKNVIDAADKLKFIGRAGVGTDNIDKDAAFEKGIVVENTPLGNINAAAEHTLTLLMMLSKHIIHSNESMKKGEWDRSFKGTELKAKTLGLIGFGNVGKKVAKVAVALEMDVKVFDPFINEEVCSDIGAKKVELDELISSSDYISPHVPLNEKTKDLISKEAFSKMKTGACIINVARGGVVNETDLLDALNEGKIRAAALDVYVDEPPTNVDLVRSQKVITTPHLGASTKEAQENVAIDIANGLLLAKNEGKIVNCVNGVKTIKE
jgi:D-3-phosphoglycerate dehydrogenase